MRLAEAFAQRIDVNSAQDRLPVSAQRDRAVVFELKLNQLRARGYETANQRPHDIGVGHHNQVPGTAVTGMPLNRTSTVVSDEPAASTAAPSG
jgi:hypothetical protein